MSTTLLPKIKAALRISHAALDEDIQADIDACLADLEVCGVTYASIGDPLIFKAVKLYCKASYTDDPAKAARYQDGYNTMKACLMMASGYGREADSDE